MTAFFHLQLFSFILLKFRCDLQIDFNINDSFRHLFWNKTPQDYHTQNVFFLPPLAATITHSFYNTAFLWGKRHRFFLSYFLMTLLPYPRAHSISHNHSNVAQYPGDFNIETWVYIWFPNSHFSTIALFVFLCCAFSSIHKQLFKSFPSLLFISIIFLCV